MVRNIQIKAVLMGLAALLVSLTFTACSELNAPEERSSVTTPDPDTETPPIIHTVTFDYLGGSYAEEIAWRKELLEKNPNAMFPAVTVRREVEVNHGDPIPEDLSEPVWPGYVFENWYLEDNSGSQGGIPYDIKTPVTEDITLLALWLCGLPVAE